MRAITRPSFTTALPPPISITRVGGERHLVRVVAVDHEVVGIVRIRAGIGAAPAVPALDDGGLRRQIAAAVAVHDRHDADMLGNDRKAVADLDLDLAP